MFNLEHVRVVNFMGFAKQSFQFDPHCSIIVGAAGKGKSAVCELFNCLRDLFDGSDVSGVFLPEHFYAGSKFMRIELHARMDSLKLHYQLELKRLKDSTIIEHEQLDVREKDGAPSTHFVYSDQLKESSIRRGLNLAEVRIPMTTPMSALTMLTPENVVSSQTEGPSFDFVREMRKIVVLAYTEPHLWINQTDHHLRYDCTNFCSWLFGRISDDAEKMVDFRRKLANSADFDGLAKIRFKHDGTGSRVMHFEFVRNGHYELTFNQLSTRQQRMVFNEGLNTFLVDKILIIDEFISPELVEHNQQVIATSLESPTEDWYEISL